MEKQAFTGHLILAAILASAIVLSALTTTGRLNPAPPVAWALPGTVGPYTSTEVLYCQDLNCAHSFVREPKTHVVTCPSCQGTLDTASPAEKNLLPTDTQIDRRVYAAVRQRLTVSVVKGGYERRSIHKPQVCLVGQGHTVTRQYQVSVPLPDAPDFKLMVMELDGSAHIFAYWFTDGQRQTASHLARLFWIAWDGVIHNERRRWAYISIMIANDNTDATLETLKHFLRSLHADVAP